jgi:nicotinate-nucleotide pyrophosphorylase (carboxylating)
MNEMVLKSLYSDIENWLAEDDLHRNHHYLRSLPETPVKAVLKFKSDMVLAGVDYFSAVFTYLGLKAEIFSELLKLEGKTLKAGEEFKFSEELPFNIIVNAERLALNLLQEASSIATWTRKHHDILKDKKIQLLDTRKTTPGLRTLQKYAVRVGGASNHRLGQADVWMIKDNHKASLGGLKGAWEFFQNQKTFYQPTVVEIHDLDELKVAIELGVVHVMLDNFSPDEVRRAVEMKRSGMTYEVSGGLNLKSMSEYLIDGVDAMSMGSLTYSAPRVDISLKYGVKS